ncbi:MAG: hypothetical protein WDN48_10775 [Pseudolabrys sp.]
MKLIRIGKCQIVDEFAHLAAVGIEPVVGIGVGNMPVGETKRLQILGRQKRRLTAVALAIPDGARQQERRQRHQAFVADLKSNAFDVNGSLWTNIDHSIVPTAINSPAGNSTDS